MKLHDALLGLIFVALGLALAAYSFSLPTPRHLTYGPGLFPRLMGVGMALSGAAMAVSALLARTPQPWVQMPDWIGQRSLALSVIIVPAACIAYLLISPFLGFFLTGTILLSVLFALAGNGIPRSVAVALAVAAGATMLFASILHVPLPWGPLAPISGWLIW
ncbi:tripartite tricarboxylate transporter TctB family protein [Paracoccus pacificus]|uniref:Tripartite tricarboxylate transporter TctB family protein n=1 Tax=Paracoccus pacificus TaxID=1463598 RepID=A0ABW4RBQ8_9RHOB